MIEEIIIFLLIGFAIFLFARMFKATIKIACYIVLFYALFVILSNVFGQDVLIEGLKKIGKTIWQNPYVQEGIEYLKEYFKKVIEEVWKFVW